MGLCFLCFAGSNFVHSTPTGHPRGFPIMSMYSQTTSFMHFPLYLHLPQNFASFPIMLLHLPGKHDGLMLPVQGKHVFPCDLVDWNYGTCRYQFLAALKIYLKLLIGLLHQFFCQFFYSQCCHTIPPAVLSSSALPFSKPVSFYRHVLDPLQLLC